VSHNLTKDKTTYHGPYGDADYQEMYQEISEYFANEPSSLDEYNCWVVELELWPEGLPKSDYQALSDVEELYE
jgi:hypothetical protein